MTPAERSNLEYTYKRLAALMKSGDIREAELDELYRLDAIFRSEWEQAQAAQTQQAPQGLLDVRADPATGPMTPPRGEDAFTPTPRKEDVMGDTTMYMARPMLESAAGFMRAAQANEPTYFRDPLLGGTERLGRQLGNLGMAGLSTLGAGLYGGAGLLGEILGGDTQDERRAARDFAGALEVAGVGPEARAIDVLTQARGLSQGARAVGERLNQPGPMPTLYSNPLIPGGGDIPNLRGLPRDEAIRAARKEPHLIPAGDRSGGAYVGGPRDIKDRKDLLRMRRELDKFVGKDTRGADWYDRYRDAVTEVTGGDPLMTQWFTNRQGQFSAGVSPQSELAFALKDLNSAIATGAPVKAARPAQQAASQRAIDANDPNKFMLGQKTGEYARLVDPNRGGTDLPGATGVNDFRHLRSLGYTEATGEAQVGAVGPAGHRFADYETALAVDRANRKALGGRTDWTGERLQAAPWVTQKGGDFYGRQEAGYLQRAEEIVPPVAADAPADVLAARSAEVQRQAMEIAMREANSTIGDYFPKHTAYATYEAQPYAGGGHLSGGVGAPKAERDAFAADPRSSWVGDDGRDALYAGMQLGDTGYAMAVRPSVGMQGIYTPPSGVTEYNAGMVARPLVAFDSGKVKSLPEADRNLLTAGEATRALVDYQGAGAFNKPWVGGQAGLSNSVMLGRSSPQPMTPDELSRLAELGARYGLPDIVDNGDMALMTSFGGPPALKKQGLLDIADEVRGMGGFSSADRVNIDSGYVGYENALGRPQGSGATVRTFLKLMDEMPRATYDAMNNNKAIGKAALQRLERDAEWSAKWGATRQDVQNLRSVIGNAKGKWIDELKRALRAGTVALPAAAAFYAAAQEPGDGS